MTSARHACHERRAEDDQDNDRYPEVGHAKPIGADANGGREENGTDHVESKI